MKVVRNEGTKERATERERDRKKNEGRKEERSNEGRKELIKEGGK